MGLTTFGAIMGFAAEMAGKTEEIYKTFVSRRPKPKPSGKSCRRWQKKKGRIMPS